MIHCLFNPLQNKHFTRTDRYPNHIVKNLSFIRIKRSKDIILHGFSVSRTSNTQFDSSKILTLQMVDNGFYSLVSSRSPTSDDFDSAHGQVQVIVNYQDPFDFQTIILNTSLYGFSAAIHISGRAKKQYAFPAHLGLDISWRQPTADEIRFQLSAP